MIIKELYVLDDLYENVKCEYHIPEMFKKAIEEGKVIKFMWLNKEIYINSEYIVSYIL